MNVGSYNFEHPRQQPGMFSPVVLAEMERLAGLRKDRLCYWYTYPGFPRWLALWTSERSEVVVARWVSQCLKVNMIEVDVIRMHHLDRPPDLR